MKLLAIIIMIVMAIAVMLLLALLLVVIIDTCRSLFRKRHIVYPSGDERNGLNLTQKHR